jgi:hypothetical protein
MATPVLESRTAEALDALWVFEACENVAGLLSVLVGARREA